jgi:hypothetical protein
MASFAHNRGEELRALKLYTSKGIGILTACMMGMLLIFGTVYWLALGLAPTAEDSRNVFQETPARPHGALTHPRENEPAGATSETTSTETTSTNSEQQ